MKKVTTTTKETKAKVEKPKAKAQVIPTYGMFKYMQTKNNK